MVCIATRCRVRDLNCLSSQDFGGDVLNYLCRGFRWDHVQIAWGGEPIAKRGKPISCIACKVKKLTRLWSLIV